MFMRFTIISRTGKICITEKKNLSQKRVSLNEKTERTQRNTESTVGFQPGTYRVFHYKVKKNEEIFFF